jgi:protein-disulfide isomerase
MQNKDRTLNTVLILMAACGLTLTGLAVVRTLDPAEASPVASETRREGEWRKIADIGHAIGPRTAPATVVVFSDFQCPFCAAAESRLTRLSEQLPGKIRIVRRHWPLVRIHRFAKDAAIAAECAADQSRFESYSASLYQNQAEIGNLRWVDLAALADVPDTAAFADCMTKRTHLSKVERDERVALSLDTRGTPTILLNGTLYVTPPSLDRLEADIRMVIQATKEPVSQ